MACTPWKFEELTALGPERVERVTQRFWRFVEKSDRCWRWMGGGISSAPGYGRFRAVNSLVQAHRFSYELLVGPIPDGLELDHLCSNRWCVNPAHLEPVTSQQNQHRSRSVSGLNAAKTHCPYGHSYGDESNVWVSASGRRFCRACQRARWDKFARGQGIPRRRRDASAPLSRQAVRSREFVANGDCGRCGRPRGDSPSAYRCAECLDRRRAEARR